MGLNGFGIGEVILIAMLVLIVFGPRRLPEVTRMVGKGIREFRKGMNEIQRELEAAGRETRWNSPPPPPPRPKPRDAAVAATIAHTTELAPGGPGDDDPAEGAGDAASGDAGSGGGARADATPADAAGADGGESAGEPSGQPEPPAQAPPAPREPVDPVADPVSEYVDPWATDSSRPTFPQKPRPSQDAAPPDP